MRAAGTGSRRRDATRNREAILSAAMEVLSRNPDGGLAEIARVSGLTRTTVYSHFATREELLEELLRQAVDHAVQVIDASNPASGPADAALQRVLAASWQQVAYLAPLGEAISRLLGDRAAELHLPVEQRLTALLSRGRREGTFRRDLPARWLLATYFALVHAAGREFASGGNTASEVEQFLTDTVLRVFAAEASDNLRYTRPHSGGDPGTSLMTSLPSG
jgi:TetR/AcrR family transcriptional regulator, mexCD-oprJ operon repressor